MVVISNYIRYALLGTYILEEKYGPTLKNYYRKITEENKWLKNFLQ